MGNPTAIVKWKGATHLQLTPTVQKNGPSGAVSHREMMSALPAKIYRKELYVSPEPDRVKNTRNFVSLDAFNSPGGNVVVSLNNTAICFEQSNGATIDMNIPSNRCERNDCESAATSAVNNARRRVRSSGMMRPKYDESKSYNPIMYCTDSRQYLEQRNKTFAQNAFHYTRTGAPSLIATTNPTDMINRYSPGGLLHCPKLHIVEQVVNGGTNEGFMEYLWIDNLTNDANEPRTNQIRFTTGYYTIEDMNDTIHAAMFANKHYFVNKLSGSKVCLMNLIYNIYEQKIELQCLSSNTFPDSEYDRPTDVLWDRPASPACPVLSVPYNEMPNIIGFVTGYYPDVSSSIDNTPNDPITPANERNNHYAILSNLPFSVFPLYKSVEYHPNNTRFAQQGAVSSSMRTLRQKYDQITSNGSTYITPYNSATANALAYNTRTSSYSKKDTLGYPGKKTAVFCANTGEMKCVDILRTKRNLP